MLVDHTLKKYPATPQLHEDCALPFGFTLQPFGEHPNVPLDRRNLGRLKDLPRCAECGAYINYFDAVDMLGFRCLLCGTYTEWQQQHSHKYSRPQTRDKQIELVNQVYEVECPDYDNEVVQQGFQALTGPFPAPKKGRPIVVAIVDTTAPQEFLDQAKLALGASLGKLPANTLVGLITVSDSVGLWDVKAGVVTVRNVPIFPTGEVMCMLEDALPLRSLLASCTDSQGQLSSAIDMIQPAASTLFGFGSAMDAIMDYVAGSGVQAQTGPAAASTANSAEDTVPLGPCRLLTFVASAPNTGLGLISDDQTGALSQAARAVPEPSPETVAFYDQVGTVAALSGVAVDMFAMGCRPIGLSALGRICQRSGGACFFYTSPERSNLPQDVVKRLCTPQAMCALLRIRTCPELRVTKVLGKVQADPDHDQIWHVVSAGPHDSLTVSLELANVHGFKPRGNDRLPQAGVQVAFQYSLMTHRAAETEEEAATAINGLVFTLQRRLRVLTIAPKIATTHDAVFQGAQLETVVCTLTQKVLARSSVVGVANARALLQSWLIAFLARWHHFAQKLPYGTAPQPGHVDVRLARLPTLASITRVVYALLRCPLLTTASASRDDSAALALLWSNLGPDAMLRSAHPVLVAFEDPERQEHTRVQLSRAAVQAAQGSVLLLDAFHLVLVVYRATATALPFPPPANSALRALVRKLIAARAIVPEVRFCVEGDADARRLDALLIDEVDIVANCDDEPALQAAQLGFAEWLNYVEGQVVDALSGAE